MIHAIFRERYKTHEGYVTVVKKAANSLVKQGFLLPEDAEQIITVAKMGDVLENK